MNSIITLITDFGTRDSYVAAMKGVILGINPDAKILDLTHEIDHQDLFEAAFFINNVLPYYPDGTIHVVVVDPGVGTDRKPIAVKIKNQYIICPDNGILTLLLHDCAKCEARKIENPDFTLDNISNTFHGRDIFSPAAAHLSKNKSFDDIGKKLDSLITFHFPQPIINENKIEGEVIHIDCFGNLITNIKGSMLDKNKKLSLKLKALTLLKINNTYGEKDKGKVLALIDSSGYLEFAINQGNAKDVLGVHRGEKVFVSFGF